MFVESAIFVLPIWLAGRLGRQRQPRIPRRAPEDERDIVGVDIHESHQFEVKTTEDFFKSEKTVKEHCLRLTTFIKWINENYNNYHSQVVVALSDEQKADKKRYYNQKYDLVYSKLNVHASHEKNTEKKKS